MTPLTSQQIVKLRRILKEVHPPRFPKKALDLYQEILHDEVKQILYEHVVDFIMYAYNRQQLDTAWAYELFRVTKKSHSEVLNLTLSIIEQNEYYYDITTLLDAGADQDTIVDFVVDTCCGKRPSPLPQKRGGHENVWIETVAPEIAPMLNDKNWRKLKKLFSPDDELLAKCQKQRNPSFASEASVQKILSEYKIRKIHEA